MWLKNFFGGFYGFDEEIKVLKLVNVNLTDEIKKLNETEDINNKRIKQLQEEATRLLNEIDLLSKQIPKPDPNEEYWNNKYPKQDITYTRKEIDATHNVDVRNFFMPFDSKIPTVKGKTNDDKALAALKWVRGNIKYVSDLKIYGITEYWAYAYQVLKNKKDDCDGGAILIANILLKSGVPYWRIRLNAGDVKEDGHCYVTYCRETDNQFVVLDWCYQYETTPIKDRQLHSEERDYYGIWFSWNQKYAFGKMETMAHIPKRFKVRK